MKPIQPEEISGLIDGELSAERAAEVRAAIEEQPELRSEFMRFQATGQDLTRFAGQAAFRLRAASQAQSSEATIEHADWKLVAMAAGVMLVVRIVAKAAAPEIGIAFEVAALAAVAVGFSAWLVRISDRGAAAFLRAGERP